MKKLFISILLLASFKVSGQIIGDYPVKNKLDSIRYELDYNRYCFLHFNKQMNTGFQLQMTGIIIGGASVFIGSKETSDKVILYGSIGGGILALIGTFIEINSYKWFKKIAFRPANYGMGMSLYF